MQDSEKLNAVLNNSVRIFACTASWPHSQCICTANHIKNYYFLTLEGKNQRNQEFKQYNPGLISSQVASLRRYIAWVIQENIPIKIFKKNGSDNKNGNKNSVTHIFNA